MIEVTQFNILLTNWLGVMIGRNEVKNIENKR